MSTLPNSNMEDMVQDLCEKLRCSFLGDDLRKLAYAHETLNKLQHREIFERILGPEDFMADLMDPDNTEAPKADSCQPLSTIAEQPSEEPVLSEDNNNSEDDVEMGDEECMMGHMKDEVLEELPENQWHGFFKGYQILSETEEFGLNENKKCIELTKRDCDESLDAYLRAGIRCFVIDLFTGTIRENQALVVRLRENELKVSHEFGFPLISTLFVRLSPRFQYTGVMELSESVVDLQKGDEITLTTDRAYSMHGTKKRIYVNARFLLDDVAICDFILIGPDIQVRVKQVFDNRLRCVVVIGGKLKKRMPVLFPGKCNKYRISLEELEDISFAREMGIHMIVSYMAGTPEYLANLHECLQLLDCTKMRICATVQLNEMKGCEDDWNWVADSYDGFLVQVLETQGTEHDCEIMHLCPAAEKFLEYAYKLKKPIIFQPTAIAENRVIVDPEHYLHVFYYPDKYVFKCNKSRIAFNFYFLQNALFEPLPEAELSKMPYCDTSHTGSDSIARAAVTAAFEMAATGIFVSDYTGRMAIKLSHFRPKVPIYCITRMKSVGNFLSMYHNIIMLWIRGRDDEPHHKSVLKHMLYGLFYARSRKLIQHEDNVMFVYAQEPELKLPDKYVTYKFDQKHFTSHLEKALFK